MQHEGEPGITRFFQNGTSSALLLTSFDPEQTMVESNQRLIVLSDATNAVAARLNIRDPVGSYPEGAKLLKGNDRSFIIAPIGHIIEEKYSPYLRFNT